MSGASPVDLIDLLADFYKKPPGSIRIVLLESTISIVPADAVLIETLLNDPTLVERYELIDGDAYMKGHPDFPKGDTRDVGALVSHLDLYRETLEREEEILMILSEGCVPGIRRAEFLSSLRKYFAEIGRLAETFQMKGVSDLILLGSGGTSASHPIGHMVKVVSGFTGLYAYVITRPFMERALQKAPSVSIDAHLSGILRDEKRHCMAPLEDGFFMKNLFATSAGDGSRVPVEEVGESSDEEDWSEIEEGD